MEIPFLRHTKSSSAKIREPINLRDRLQSLSTTVTELKQGLKQELNATESLEKTEKRHHDTLYNQLYAIKRAFGELADALSEEVEKVQGDLKTEMRQELRKVIQRVEVLTEDSRTNSDERSRLNTSISHTMRTTAEQMTTLQQQQDRLQEELAELKELVLKTQTDNKQVFEQMRSIIHNNITHTSALQKGQHRFSEELKDLSLQAANCWKAIEESQRRMLTMEQTFSVSCRGLEDKLADMKSKVKSITSVSTIHDQERSHANIQISDKVGELSQQVHQRISTLNTYLDDKLKDMEDRFTLLQQPSSSRAHYSSNTEDRELRQRVDYLESMLQTQRREIFASLTTLEQSTVKRHESVVRGIYQLSRELNVETPPLMGF